MIILKRVRLIAMLPTLLHKLAAPLRQLSMLALLALGLQAWAQENTIESIRANQQGSNVIVKVSMKKPIAKPPIGFSVTNPARIALDFASTTNGTGKNRARNWFG